MKNSADQGGCYPQRPRAEVDNTLRDLQNFSYPLKAEFNNCVIIHLKYFLLLKVHLTPQNFFSLKRIYFLFQILLWKNFLIRINPRFSVPRRNIKNSSKTPPFLLHDRVWGEWVQQLLWRLPRKIEYLPSPHFLEDNAVHIRKVCRNAFYRCSRLLQQYPRHKERYTVQFNGDDRSIVQ